MVVNYALIGKRIATRRKQLKMTQTELADKADLTAKYISKLETSKDAKPSIKSVLQLCKALEISPNYLLSGIKDDDVLDDYTETAHKLKLCNTEQLRQVSKFIDMFIME